MSSHRQRPVRRISARARAVMSLGAVGFLALGFGAQGTFAFWTDAATVTPGNFASGTLDITVDGKLGGQGGTTPVPGFGLANMAPGESQAVTIPVGNAGSVGFTYTISGSATGGLAPQMQYSIFPGTASNATAPNGVRTGSCTGTALVSNQVLTTTTTALTAARNLASGSENICVLARLNPDAGNAFQGLNTAATLVFDAKQVGAP